MDNLTHTATGLFLSRSGLGRNVPHAAWILVLAANAPDIDIVSIVQGPMGYLNHHRHATHALPLMPLMALLPVLLVRWLGRKRLPWKRAYAISLAGVASHLALDFTNIYGIRLMAPFNTSWYRLDSTSVIDFWIWGVIALAICGPALVRLVNTEIGAKKAAPGRGFAVFALAFVFLYNAGRGVLHARAEAVLEARMYEGLTPVRVAALPGPANPFRWRGLVETAQFYSVHDIDLLDDFDPSQGRRFFKPQAGEAIEAASRTATFRDFLRFSQFPFWRVVPEPEPEGATRVEVMDMRFGTPVSPGFVATAILDARGRPLRTWFSFGSAGPR